MTVRGGVLAEEVDIDDRPPAPQAAKRLVDDNTSKPRADPRLTAEGVEIGEGANVGLLQNVFSLAIISHDATCDAIEPAVLLLDNHPDGRAVLTARALDDLGFIRSDWLKGMFGHGDPGWVSNCMLDADVAERFPP